LKAAVAFDVTSVISERLSKLEQHMSCHNVSILRDVKPSIAGHDRQLEILHSGVSANAKAIHSLQMTFDSMKRSVDALHMDLHERHSAVEGFRSQISGNARLFSTLQTEFDALRGSVQDLRRESKSPCRDECEPLITRIATVE
jgi:chromosome segregation ATPase